MALKIARGKNLPIGLDIGSVSVKMAQLRQGAEQLEVLAAGSVELPSDCQQDSARQKSALAKGIRSILRSNRFRGRQCNLSVPAEATVVQHVRIPRKLPAEDASQAVRGELEGKLPYPVAEAVIRHMVAGEVHGDGDGKQEVIAVSVRRSTLEGFLEAAYHAKLDIVGVSVEPCAIVQCFARLFRRVTDSARTTLFIDLGAQSTQAVLAHGDQIVFARNLFIAGRQLDQAIADGLKLSPDQAHALRQGIVRGAEESEAEDELYHLLEGTLNTLADELTQCLRYYHSVFPNRSIERAIFLGGQAHDKRLCQAIAQRLNLPAQIGDPLLHIGCAEGTVSAIGMDRREPQPSWAVAVGLSLSAAAAA